MVARNADIFVLVAASVSLSVCLCVFVQLKKKGTDHIEGDDIAKGDFAGLVPLHEETVNNLWAAAGRKAEDKRFLRRRIKRFDPACGC